MDCRKSFLFNNLLTWPLSLSYLPQKAISFFVHSWIFINENVTITWWVVPKFFLLIRAFLTCFLWAIFYTPTQWHASTSFGDLSTLISFKIYTNFSSKLWSETLSEITIISILFFCPYYSSSELWSLSRVKVSFWNISFLPVLLVLNLKVFGW